MSDIRVYTPEVVAELLDKLAQARATLDEVHAQTNASIEAVLTDEQRESIKRIEASGKARADILSGVIAELETDIRTGVIGLDQSVRGSSLRAIKVAGRVTWDSKALEGAAAMMPELQRFRKEGAPSVRIMEIKSKGEGASDE